MPILEDSAQASPEQTGAGDSRIAGRRLMLAGIGASYLQSAVAMAAGLISTRIYVGELGNAHFGLWLTASSIINYLRLGSNSMSVTGAMKATRAYACGEDREVGRLMVTSGVIGVGFATLSLGLVTLAMAGLTFGDWWRGGHGPQFFLMLWVLLILAAGSLASQGSEVFTGAIRVRQRVDLEQSISALLRLTLLGAGIAVVLLGGGVIALAVVTALHQAGTALLYWRVVRRTFPDLNLRWSQFDGQIARSLFAPSLQYCVVAMGSALIWSTDNIVISVALGTAAVTPFAVAMQLLNFSNVMFSTVLNALTNMTTALHALGEGARLRVMVLTIAKIGLALEALLLVGYASFGQEFLRLWVGPERVVSLPVFLVLVAVFAIKTFGVMFEMIVLGTLNHKRYSILLIIEGLLNLTLSIVLVRRMGLLGVALGTLIAQTVCSGWYLPYIGLRIAGCRFGELVRCSILPVLPAIVAAVVVARLFLLLPLAPSWAHLVLGAAATTLSHVSLFLWFGLGPNEKDLLRTIRKRVRWA